VPVHPPSSPILTFTNKRHIRQLWPPIPFISQTDRLWQLSESNGLTTFLRAFIISAAPLNFISTSVRQVEQYASINPFHR
jgi:hypothetical protein